MPLDKSKIEFHFPGVAPLKIGDLVGRKFNYLSFELNDYFKSEKWNISLREENIADIGILEDVDMRKSERLCILLIKWLGSGTKEKFFVRDNEVNLWKYIRKIEHFACKK